MTRFRLRQLTFFLMRGGSDRTFVGLIGIVCGCSAGVFSLIGSSMGISGVAFFEGSSSSPGFSGSAAASSLPVTSFAVSSFSKPTLFSAVSSFSSDLTSPDDSSPIPLKISSLPDPSATAGVVFSTRSAPPSLCSTASVSERSSAHREA